MSEENNKANPPEPETPAERTEPTPAAAGESPAEAPQGAAGNAPPSKPGKSKLVPVLLVLCLLGIGFLGWQWWQMRSQLAGAQSQVTERLGQSDDVAREARAGVRQVQDSLTSLQGKVGLLDAKMAESEGQAAALEDLYQEFSRTRDERMMAEIEQAVTIASQQLQLAGNVEAALIALQGAEARLATAKEGRLGPLRRAMARDIERLRATPRVDVTGITLKLEHLLEVADTLPLTFTDQAEPNAAPEKRPKGAFMDDPLGYAKALAGDVWAEIRAMVRIERLDAAADPVLLSPSQSTFLRENLKIRLLTARLALLGRDARTFEADVSRSADWIARYFDQSKPEVQSALATLRQLQGISVAPQQPMLTETMAVLQNMQGRPPIAPVVPIAPEAAPAAKPDAKPAAKPEAAAKAEPKAASEPAPAAAGPADAAPEQRPTAEPAPAAAKTE
jgi:uroporphyrin-3 C-methyltransferase